MKKLRFREVRQFQGHTVIFVGLGPEYTFPALQSSAFGHERMLKSLRLKSSFQRPLKLCYLEKALGLGIQLCAQLNKE